METQKISNCLSSLEKKKPTNLQVKPSRTQTILKKGVTVSKQFILAQKHTHRSMKQNINPRDKPTYFWLTNLLQRKQEYIIETVSSTSDIGKTRQSHAKQ